MNKIDGDLDGQIQTLLDPLWPVDPLDPQAGAQARAKFLSQARTLRPGVSLQPEQRHIRWIGALQEMFKRKEPMLMLRTLIVLVVTLALLLGGAGASVLAAQGSLPGEPFYAVKAFSEDAQLALAGSDQAQLEQTLELTDRRVAEAVQLHNAAQPIPDAIALRLQEHLNASLQIAAGMDDEELAQALAQIRTRAATQASTMTSLMAGASEQANAALTRMQTRLQTQASLAAMGESDPQRFRTQVRAGLENPNGKDPDATGNFSDDVDAALDGSVAGQPEATPQLSEVTPDPVNNSYGPGPGGPPPTEYPAGYGPEFGAGLDAELPGSYGPGPNLTPTPQAGGPGLGSGQSTVTPQANGDPQSGPPPHSPGKGGKH